MFYTQTQLKNHFGDFGGSFHLVASRPPQARYDGGPAKSAWIHYGRDGDVDSSWDKDFLMPLL